MLVFDENWQGDVSLWASRIYFDRSWKNIPDAVKKDREVVEKFLDYADSHLFIKLLAEVWSDDESFMKKATEKYWRNFSHFSMRLRSIKENALFAVKIYGSLLRDVSPELQADKEVVKAAVLKDGFAFEYADVRLRNDADFIQDLFKTAKAYPSLISLRGLMGGVTEEFKRDKAKMMMVVEYDGALFDYASDGLKYDQDLMAAALISDPKILFDWTNSGSDKYKLSLDTVLDILTAKPLRWADTLMILLNRCVETDLAQEFIDLTGKSFTNYKKEDIQIFVARKRAKMIDGELRASFDEMKPAVKNKKAPQTKNSLGESPEIKAPKKKSNRL